MFAFLISSFILLLALFVFLIKIWAISSKIVFLIPSLIISLTSIIYYLIGTPSPNAMQIVTSSDNAKLTENLLISQELPEPVLSKSELKILIKRLESRLEINPNNINGWILLARTYINQQDFSKGIVVLKKSLKLLPEKPDLMAELADAMMSRGSNETIHDKPLGLLKRSLEIDPNHQKSLALMATYLMSSKQNEKSIIYWTKLKENLPDNSEDYDLITKIISNLSKPNLLSKNNNYQEFQINGVVVFEKDVLKDFKKNLPHDKAVVFIIAKDPNDKKIPIAVKKIRVLKITNNILKEGKFMFTISDSNSMLPNRKLSNFKKIQFEARLSHEGTPEKMDTDFSSQKIIFEEKSEGLRLFFSNSQIK